MFIYIYRERESESSLVLLGPCDTSSGADTTISSSHCSAFGIKKCYINSFIHMWSMWHHYKPFDLVCQVPDPNPKKLYLWQPSSRPGAGSAVKALTKDVSEGVPASDGIAGSLHLPQITFSHLYISVAVWGEHTMHWTKTKTILHPYIEIWSNAQIQKDRKNLSKTHGRALNTCLPFFMKTWITYGSSNVHRINIIYIYTLYNGQPLPRSAMPCRMSLRMRNC